MDYRYPLLWGIDLRSYYKSLWLGWWLVTWCHDPPNGEWWRTMEISFQPGL